MVFASGQGVAWTGRLGVKEGKAGSPGCSNRSPPPAAGSVEQARGKELSRVIWEMLFTGKTSTSVPVFGRRSVCTE